MFEIIVSEYDVIKWLGNGWFIVLLVELIYVFLLNEYKNYYLVLC